MARRALRTAAWGAVIVVAGLASSPAPGEERPAAEPLELRLDSDLVEPARLPPDASDPVTRMFSKSELRERIGKVRSITGKTAADNAVRLELLADRERLIGELRALAVTQDRALDALERAGGLGSAGIRSTPTVGFGPVSIPLAPLPWLVAAVLVLLSGALLGWALTLRARAADRGVGSGAVDAESPGSEATERPATAAMAGLAEQESAPSPRPGAAVAALVAAAAVPEPSPDMIRTVISSPSSRRAEPEPEPEAPVATEEELAAAFGEEPEPVADGQGPATSEIDIAEVFGDGTAPVDTTPPRAAPRAPELPSLDFDVSSEPDSGADSLADPTEWAPLDLDLGAEEAGSEPAGREAGDAPVADVFDLELPDLDEVAAGEPAEPSPPVDEPMAVPEGEGDFELDFEIQSDPEPAAAPPPKAPARAEPPVGPAEEIDWTRTMIRRKAADPNALREVDTLIAFENYERAKDLLGELVRSNPGNPEYRLRLLHIESVMGDATKQQEEEEILRTMMDGPLSDTMYRVKEIGRGLMPGHPLFEDPAKAAEAKRILDAHAGLEVARPAPEPEVETEISFDLTTPDPSSADDDEDRSLLNEIFGIGDPSDDDEDETTTG